MSLRGPRARIAEPPVSAVDMMRVDEAMRTLRDHMARLERSWKRSGAILAAMHSDVMTVEEVAHDLLEVIIGIECPEMFNDEEDK